MKYAIVEISGRQFWIEEGKYYDFNRISIKRYRPIFFSRVLLYKETDSENEYDSNDADDSEDESEYVLIGKPYLSQVEIRGRILEHLRDKKVIVYKMRPKKKTRKKQGHRQELTRVFIKEIRLLEDNPIAAKATDSAMKDFLYSPALEKILASDSESESDRNSSPTRG